MCHGFLLVSLFFSNCDKFQCNDIWQLLTLKYLLAFYGFKIKWLFFCDIYWPLIYEDVVSFGDLAVRIVKVLRLIITILWHINEINYFFKHGNALPCIVKSFKCQSCVSLQTKNWTIDKN